MKEIKNYYLNRQQAEQYLQEFAKNNNIDYPQDLLTLDVYRFNHVVLNEKIDLKFLVRDILNKEIENVLNSNNSKYGDRYYHLLFKVLPKSDFVNAVYRDSVYCRLLSLLITSYSDLSIKIVDKNFINGSSVLYGHTYYSTSIRISNYVEDLNNFLYKCCSISDNLICELCSYVLNIMNAQCNIIFNKPVKSDDDYISDMMKFSNYECNDTNVSRDGYMDILSKLYFKHYVSANYGLNNYTILYNTKKFVQITKNVIKNVLNGKYTMNESGLEKLISDKVEECYKYFVENNLYLGFGVKDDNHIKDVFNKPSIERSSSF